MSELDATREDMLPAYPGRQVVVMDKAKFEEMLAEVERLRQRVGELERLNTDLNTHWHEDRDRLLALTNELTDTRAELDAVRAERDWLRAGRPAPDPHCRVETPVVTFLGVDMGRVDG